MSAWNSDGCSENLNYLWDFVKKNEYSLIIDYVWKVRVVPCVTFSNLVSMLNNYISYISITVTIVLDLGKWRKKRSILSHRFRGFQNLIVGKSWRRSSTMVMEIWQSHCADQKAKDEAGTWISSTPSHLILPTRPHLCKVLKFPKTPSWRQSFKVGTCKGHFIFKLQHLSRKNE